MFIRIVALSNTKNRGLANSRFSVLIPTKRKKRHGHSQLPSTPPPPPGRRFAFRLVYGPGTEPSELAIDFAGFYFWFYSIYLLSFVFIIFSHYVAYHKDIMLQVRAPPWCRSLTFNLNICEDFKYHRPKKKKKKKRTASLLINYSRHVWNFSTNDD